MNSAKRATVLKFASGVPPCTERTNTGYLALVAWGKRIDLVNSAGAEVKGGFHSINRIFLRILISLGRVT